MSADFSLETQHWTNGYSHIVGIDEVGRGAWAGPVVAAAVVFPSYVTLPKLPRDSKTLSERQRHELKAIIEMHALTIGIGEIPASEIDHSGIVPSTHQAMHAALTHLTITPDYYLVDGSPIPPISQISPTPQTALPKGDAISATIAAASIIAKVYRDELMKTLAQDSHYAAYGFEKHKGYGTAYHREAIVQHGPSSIHRTSFIPHDLR